MIYKDDTVVVPLEIIALNHVVIMTVAHIILVTLHTLPINSTENGECFQ
jgi:hypothetical protein